MRTRSKTGIILIVCIFLILLCISRIPVPEPENCSLCGNMRYHAPCILDLATGEVGELRVYDPNPERLYELAEHQQTGTFSFLDCAGLSGWRDTSNSTSQVTVQEKCARVSQKYYCLECRELLANATVRGYALVDLYDLEHIRIWSIYDGAHYSIRDYSVDIYRSEESAGLHVRVTGELFPAGG